MVAAGTGRPTETLESIREHNMASLRSIVGRLAPMLGFRTSRQYWETRYRIGGHSGEGSRGHNAEYKASVLNAFFVRHGVRRAIEFGCGDGYQVNLLAIYDYTGIDVSAAALARCRKLYGDDPGKRFVLADEYDGQQADVALSLDVIFHLVEDGVYDRYLEQLFAAGERYVIVYSTSVDMRDTGVPHVRHRDVTRDIAARFPDFVREEGEESELPPPVSFDRGQPVRFFLYRRNTAHPD